MASPVDAVLGPLADDPAITEIMINGPGPVWVERAGRVERTTVEIDGTRLGLLIEAMVAPLGLRVDRSSPVVDARLADGSRINVVVPPLTLGGPVVSIRRFARSALPLAAFGPPGLERVLEQLVGERATMLVVGPTSSGKTSLVATLIGLTDPADRVICIEDTIELPIARPNLVRLEARPANSEGVGEVTVRRLVLNALRMRPDRLVVGEVRGSEAFDLLLALTSGHRGCFTTCHAETAEGALRRLEILASLAGPRVGARLLARLVGDGLDAVVVADRRGSHRQVRRVAMVEHGRLVDRWVSPSDRAVAGAPPDLRPETGSGSSAATDERLAA